MNIAGYDIIRPIGIGGMATVYLAEQLSLNRKVVLKVLRLEGEYNPTEVERFLNEGRILATLSHPNIVTIYDVGRTENLVYISMEFVEGGDLKTLLGKPLDARFALKLTKAITLALECAHRAGIIHRDVKPANILFRADGTPLLSDFGIAKKIISGEQELTHTGTFLGSPNYMAPEQADVGTVDGRADIYSLGIILYEMFTGSKPYQSQSVVNILVQHREAPIPKLPEPLKMYQRLLNLMLAKKRAERFRYASNLLGYLEEITGATGAAPSVANANAAAAQAWSEQPLSPEYAPRSGKPTRLNRALQGCLVIMVLAYGGLSYTVKRQQDFAPPAPTTAYASVANVSELAPPAPLAYTPPLTTEVRDALLWLGQKSLRDYRLTAPPKHNAHYYFSQVLQSTPDDARAVAGMQQIAVQFALLAENELARGNDALAEKYVSAGITLDPTNAQLRTLSAITTKPPPTNGLEKLKNIFGGDNP